MEGTKTFGETLSKLRKSRKVSVRALATKINLSAPYLSDVENGRTAPLIAERLEDVRKALNLTDEEYAELNDAAGDWNDSTFPPDLKSYIKESQPARLALRAARDLDASDQDWFDFLEQLKKKKGR